jgi:LPXTG-motif cell wall-anchored protein
VRLLSILALTFAAALISSSPGFALTPRVAICGRVTFLDVVTPGGPIVRLGTQELRHLATGAPPQLGQEVCIFGVDVGTQAEPGIAAFSVVPVASIGCANAVIGTSAFFEMPGEALSPLPNHAFVVLPLSAPPGSACVRMAVNAQGNPVAVLLPAVASPSPTATPGASVASLPSTSAGEDHGWPALIAIGTILAAVGLIVRRRRIRAIPS